MFHGPAGQQCVESKPRSYEATAGPLAPGTRALVEERATPWALRIRAIPSPVASTFPRRGRPPSVTHYVSGADCNQVENLGPASASVIDACRLPLYGEAAASRSDVCLAAHSTYLWSAASLEIPSSVRTVAPAARPVTAPWSAVAASASANVAATWSDSSPSASAATRAASRAPSART
jgi:hypothetical protein